jgi:hypothetical protein
MHFVIGGTQNKHLTLNLQVYKLNGVGSTHLKILNIYSILPGILGGKDNFEDLVVDWKTKLKLILCKWNV